MIEQRIPVLLRLSPLWLTAVLCISWLAVPTVAAGHISGGTDSRLSISGRVDADGQPAAGATVVLRRAGGVAAIGDVSASGGAGLSSAVTDDSGAFKFDSVAQGAYQLQVSLAGYVAASGVLGPANDPLYYRPGDTARIEMVKGGVVTGRVTDSSGTPLPEAPVRAIRVKDEQGRPTFDIILSDMDRQALGWHTDDRGIYRIYGLKAGSYLVAAGGGSSMVGQFLPQPYSGDAPTYYPANPRATAVEVPVQLGGEATGIDITYLSLKGHSVSGAINGQTSSSAGILSSLAIVMLTNVATGSMDSLSIALGDSGGRNFRLSGVADGEYYLTALGGLGQKDISVSEPLKIKVNGADLSGLSVTLALLPELDGVLSFAPEPRSQTTSAQKSCGPAQKIAEEFVLRADKQAGRAEQGLPALAKFFGSASGSPDDHGAFRVPLSSGGHYHIKVSFPGRQFYVNSVKRAGVEKNGTAVDVSSGVDVKMGDKLSGLAVSIGTDGAEVAGRVAPAKQGATLPIDLSVMIVPAETESSDNLFRYREALVSGDGNFKIENLAPGKYFILARRLGTREWNDPDRQPSYWEPRKRKELLAEAKAANKLLDLRPCQVLDGYSLVYQQPASAAPKPSNAR